MYVQGLTELILNQVHYYFSPENLVRDQYLRQHMDGEGWIPIGFAALVENAVYVYPAVNGAPSASPDRLKARGSPTHSRAQPNHLVSLPWSSPQLP